LAEAQRLIEEGETRVGLVYLGKALLITYRLRSGANQLWETGTVTTEEVISGKRLLTEVIANLSELFDQTYLLCGWPDSWGDYYLQQQGYLDGELSVLERKIMDDGISGGRLVLLSEAYSLAQERGSYLPSGLIAVKFLVRELEGLLLY